MKNFFTVLLTLNLLIVIQNSCLNNSQDKEKKIFSKNPNSTNPEVELGTEKNPLIMAFVPSTEAQKIVEGAEPLANLLEEKTGYKIKNLVATSYIAVVESLGLGHTHIAWLPPMAYVLAHSRNNARVILKAVRDGKDTYYGFIGVRKDSGIKDLKALVGKKFAFVEPASASGHLYPRALLLENGINPDKDFKEVVFAGSHDAVVIAIFNGSVDAGAFYDDAREKFKESMPEILDQTRIIAKTQPIPADNVTVAGNLPEGIVETLTRALLEIAHEEEGRKILYDIYEIEDLIPAKDKDYDSLRKVAKILDLDLAEELAKE